MNKSLKKLKLLNGQNKLATNVVLAFLYYKNADKISTVSKVSK